MNWPSSTSAFDLLPKGAPRLGFGCGDLYAGSAQAASARLVETAFDSGIRYFDVARLYGDGAAEGVLGDVLGPVRERVVITSKAGILPWSMRTGARIANKAATIASALSPLAKRWLSGRPAPAERYHAFGRHDLTRSVERSLKALRTDYLDVLLLHECELDDVRKVELLRSLETMHASGKIRRFGIAAQFPATLEILADPPKGLSVVQFEAGPLNRNVAALPPSGGRLVITHSILKAILPKVVARLASDPIALAQWRQDIDIAPDDAVSLAALVLSNALAAHDGLALFSTSHAERIGNTVARCLEMSPEQQAAFRRWAHTHVAPAP